MKSITALIVLTLLSSGSAENIRYVRPNDSLSHTQSCPGEPCLNLHQYLIERATEYFTNGSNFIFLAGNHTLLTAANLSMLRYF